MSKKKHRPSTPSNAPASQNSAGKRTKNNSGGKSSKPSRKTLLLLLLLAVGAFAGWKFWSKKSSGFALEAVRGAEETLTAKNPVLQLLSTKETGIDFQNRIIETAENNINNNINQYNGGGVSIADVNNDQLPDIYFICTNGKNKLYLNQGNLKFKDITDEAGLGSEDGFETAVTAADVNADGFLDFYVCRAGPLNNAERVSKLYINNGTTSPGQVPSFTEKGKEYGLADKSLATGANFFDYDNDGDLDCFLLNYPEDLESVAKLRMKYGPDGKTLVPDLTPDTPTDSDRLYRNDSPTPGQAGEAGKPAAQPRFTDISKQSGIWNFGFGLSVSVTDINRDGWPDVYVSNDFTEADNFFVNNQHGGFDDHMNSYFRHCTMSSMGTDLSDFDNDGLVDVLSVDMLPIKNYRQKTLKTTNALSRHLMIVKNGYFEPVARNMLQRNNGNGTFSDIACAAGIFKTDWSWSCLLADLDNDGLKDLHIANGYRREITNRDYQEFMMPEIDKGMAKNKKKTLDNMMDYLDRIPSYKVRNIVYQNKGDWQFADRSGDWMTMPASWSCGGAWADLDADGDLDLVINNLEEPAFVYKNLSREQNGGNYLQAKLQGSPANPFAVGASVLIEYQGKIQYQELNPNHGIFSSVEHLIHFGLGQTEQVDKLTIRWPDGKTQTLTNVPVNQRLKLQWADASGYVASLIPAPPSTTLFTDKTALSGLYFTHKENEFSDFETWLLNPWTLTDLGPLMAQGDLNGDGLDDFFVGNAANQSSSVYLQTASGTFRPTSEAVFEKDKNLEDHGAVFFDADGDKDLDIIVLSGSAEAASAAAAPSRLYLNDGKGNLTKADNAVGPLKVFGLRVAAQDYDADGDQDLFIGGRLEPKNWPLTPRSAVLQNNGGKFTDITAQVGGDFERCGMVTDLNWADLDGDGQKELVVVGEWMPVTVFKLKNNRLENVTAQFGLEKTNGLWNRLVFTDLDKDGDLDLVTGNLGLNTRFSASAEGPLRCYAKDFDNNGTLDPIVAFAEDGKFYPIMQKEVLVKQLPSLKKKFLYSEDYGKATMSDIYAQKELDAALNLFCYELKTCWWENQGGKFVQHTLPTQAQLSPVQGIVADDFNGDGHLDLLMAGNKYGFEVETNRCDAGNGALFTGDGKGNFAWVDNLQTGFWATREARDLAMLRGASGKRLVVVANNNRPAQVFQR
ncbi:MAG: VCBS repeat-containing protein [Saprospiraceae bacterium]